jgi:lipopolysaccharide transport system permease protein
VPAGGAPAGEAGRAPAGRARRTRIRPSRGWSLPDPAEVWAYRELVYTLTWRDLKVRYKQTLLGATWAVLQPLLAMAIFTVIFGWLADLPSDGIPYPIFVYAALVPWTYFANSLAQVSQCLVSHQHIVLKVYFPRLVLPVSGVLSGVVDFLLAFAVLLAMMGFYGVPLTLRVLWTPLFLLLAMATALGAGLWLSALNVLYRDVRFVVPFLTQIWMFASPIIYSTSMIPERWRPLYALNPMAGVVEGFRWMLLDAAPPDPSTIAASSAALLVVVLGGLLFFRRVERTLADLV